MFQISVQWYCTFRYCRILQVSDSFLSSGVLFLYAAVFFRFQLLVPWRIIFTQYRRLHTSDTCLIKKEFYVHTFFLLSTSELFRWYFDVTTDSCTPHISGICWMTPPCCSKKSPDLCTASQMSHYNWVCSRVHRSPSFTSLLLFAVHFSSLCWYDLKRERHYFETQELFKYCIPFSWERFALLPMRLRNSKYSPVLFSSSRRAFKMDCLQENEIAFKSYLERRREMTIPRESCVYFWIVRCVKL
jgi:hypothetical protein